MSPQVGNDLWNDRHTYKISSLPSFLQSSDCVLFQGPHKAISQGTVITVSTTAASTIYVAVDNVKDGGFTVALPNMDWITETEVLKYRATVYRILSKTISPGSITTTLPATTTTPSATTTTLWATTWTPCGPRTDIQPVA